MSEQTHSPDRHVWYRPMLRRSIEEPYRTATSLELFFDLCFVVGVALASGRLHHAIAEGHVLEGVMHYGMVFFAIWWAWMNFTWFASAYDTDDIPYRLMTLVQMVGVLVLAAGVPRAFDNEDISLTVIGYVIMRLAMVGQWLRAAHANPGSREVALRYAIGIAVAQVAWIGLAFVDSHELIRIGFAAGVLMELTIPIWAERVGRTTWHPHHITERYGLFTLIVMGESILASTSAIQVAADSGHDDLGLISLAITGLIIVFSMWWLYFDREAAHYLTSMSRAFLWGYGHLILFAAAAAVGAGIAVGIDYKMHETHISEITAVLALAVPAAVFLLGVWMLQVLPEKPGFASVAYPVAALLMVLIPIAGLPGQLLILPPVTLVAVSIWTEARRHREAERVMAELQAAIE